MCNRVLQCNCRTLNKSDVSLWTGFNFVSGQDRRVGSCDDVALVLTHDGAFLGQLHFRMNLASIQRFTIPVLCVWKYSNERLYWFVYEVTEEMLDQIPTLLHASIIFTYR
jgi:hypothetical protein